MKPVLRLLGDRMSQDWHRGLLALVNLVCPPQCAICGRNERLVPELNSGDWSIGRICVSCQSTLGALPQNTCQVCGAPLGSGIDGSAGCFHCRSESFRFHGVIAGGVYGDVLKQAIRRAQRSDGELFAAGLATWIWHQSNARLTSLGCDLVVTPSRHWRDRWWTPCDTVQTLGHQLAHRLKVPYSPWAVVKSRHTKKQASSPQTERRRQLRNAYTANPSISVSGRTVLFVDDVLTTGATAQAVTMALLNAGAAKVHVCVLARGLGNAN